MYGLNAYWLPRSQPSDNFFRFKVMRNRMGQENSLKQRLRPFIFNNITASMGRGRRITLRFLLPPLNCQILTPVYCLPAQSITLRYCGPQK